MTIAPIPPRQNSCRFCIIQENIFCSTASYSHNIPFYFKSLYQIPKYFPQRWMSLELWQMVLKAFSAVGQLHPSKGITDTAISGKSDVLRALTMPFWANWELFHLRNCSSKFYIYSKFICRNILVLLKQIKFRSINAECTYFSMH